MAKRGPKAKPKTSGTSGKCPTAPDWLTARGKRDWKRLAQPLNALGLLELLDRDLLALYCDAFDGWLTAREHIAKSGATVVVNEFGYEQASPYVAMMRANAKAMRDLMVDLGMTPGSRSSLTGSTSMDPNAVTDVESPMVSLLKEFQKRNSGG